MILHAHLVELHSRGYNSVGSRAFVAMNNAWRYVRWAGAHSTSSTFPTPRIQHFGAVPSNVRWNKLLKPVLRWGVLYRCFGRMVFEWRAPQPMHYSERHRFLANMYGIYLYHGIVCRVGSFIASFKKYFSVRYGTPYLTTLRKPSEHLYLRRRPHTTFCGSRHRPHLTRVRVSGRNWTQYWHVMTCRLQAGTQSTTDCNLEALTYWMKYRTALKEGDLKGPSVRPSPVIRKADNGS